MRRKINNDMIYMTPEQLSVLGVNGKVTTSCADKLDGHLALPMMHTALFRSLIEQAVAARTADLLARNQELERKNKELEYQASHDVLTGAYSRRKFEIRITEELKRQQRYTTHSSLAMLDIDYFKAINDQYGHSGGDIALCQLAHLIKHNIRECDMLARWGGEEFMLLFPECSLDEARTATDKIRKIIADHHFAMVNKLTCSFGLTQLSASDNTLCLLKRVDDALYEAKHLGRNKVVCM